MIEPAELTPARLLAEARLALADAPPATALRIDMEGLTRIRARVHRLLEGRAT
jgi:predicted glycosyltransferase